MKRPEKPLKLAERARYEVAYCAYKSSLKPEYASESTDKAIRAFEDFAETNRDNELSREAAVTIQRLKDKAAEKPYSTAKFYERQKRYESAIIYYREVVERFPECSFVNESKAKIEELQLKRENR